MEVKEEKNQHCSTTSFFLIFFVEQIGRWCGMCNIGECIQESSAKNFGKRWVCFWAI